MCIGLLILAGQYKSHGEFLYSMWSDETDFSVYIPLKPIFRVVRFDNKETRIQHRTYNKLAAIRDLWE